MKDKDMWKYVRLKDAARLMLGKTPPKKNTENFIVNGRNEEGIPWVKIEDMNRRKISCTREYLSRTGAELGKIIPRGAVLLSVNGTIGKAAIAGCELETNQQIMAIVCKEESGILPEYLYYYLLFARKTLQSMAYQTVLERLSTNTLEQILIPVAPVEVQKSWIRQLELVEDYIWKKEDLLSEVNKARSSGWILEINLMRADYTLKKLQETTSRIIETAEKLLRALLEEMFQEADREKYFRYRDQVFQEQQPWERLDTKRRGFVQLQLSDFQKRLYREFYNAGKPSAVHEILKHMKAEYSDYHIQDAVTSVEILFQLGLLSKETFKLYYDRKDPGEENEVKDENGEALVIDIWSCVSSALSTT